MSLTVTYLNEKLIQIYSVWILIEESDSVMLKSNVHDFKTVLYLGNTFEISDKIEIGIFRYLCKMLKCYLLCSRRLTATTR